MKKLDKKVVLEIDRKFFKRKELFVSVKIERLNFCLIAILLYNCRVSQIIAHFFKESRAPLDKTPGTEINLRIVQCENKPPLEVRVKAW